MRFKCKLDMNEHLTIAANQSMIPILSFSFFVVGSCCPSQKYRVWWIWKWTFRKTKSKIPLINSNWNSLQRTLDADTKPTTSNCLIATLVPWILFIWKLLWFFILQVVNCDTLRFSQIHNTNFLFYAVTCLIWALCPCIHLMYKTHLTPPNLFQSTLMLNKKTSLDNLCSKV